LNTKEYNNVAKSVSGKLYSYLKKSLGDAAVAQDLVQESFEKLWKHHKELEMEQAEKWLFTTGYRAMLNWIRKNKRMDRMEEAPPEIPVHSENQYDLKEWIELGLAQLSPAQKQIILLRDMQGYSYQEIEEITELSADQVKVYLFRARKKLKTILSKLAET